jgi:predicted alpha/beta-fold hydrolase
MAAGYSLGSVLLAKYLAEADHGMYSTWGSGLVAAALVSPPICLHSTNARLTNQRSLDFMYNLAVAYK